MDTLSFYTTYLSKCNFDAVRDRIIEEYSKQGYGQHDFAQTLRIELSDTKLKFIASEYAYYMLWGRKSGKQPPIQAIKEWCDYKHITSKAAPFLIARKIGREGTKGNDFLSPILTEVLYMVGEEIKKQIAENYKIPMI